MKTRTGRMIARKIARKTNDSLGTHDIDTLNIRHIR